MANIVALNLCTQNVRAAIRLPKIDLFWHYWIVSGLSVSRRYIINGFSLGPQRGLPTSLAASHYTVLAKEAFTLIFK